MAWIVLGTLALVAGLVYGAIAGTAARYGRQRAIRSAAVLGAIAAVAGGLAYSAYLETKRGALDPAHFLNSVAGQIVVVGGMIAAAAALIGILAAYLTVLRR